MSDIEFKFINFIGTHGKTYTTENEYAFRMALFAKVDKEIEQFNASESSSKHGHNFMSDFTDNERKARLGYQDMSDESVDFADV